jgi:hypothetical protein
MKSLSDKPCNECPFRKKSLPGWLGQHTIDEIYEFKNSDENFTCHLTRETGKEHMCAGYVHFRNNHCQMSKYNVELRNLEKEFKSSEYKKDCLGFDFREHHTKFLKDGRAI